MQALEKVEPQSLSIPTDLSDAAVEMAVGMGDFSRFSPADTLRYLSNVCRSLQLNPLTLPIRIIEMDGRKVMYATSECAAQLRARDKVSIETVSEKVENGCYMVRVKAKLPDGRSQENVGVISLEEPDKIKTWENRQPVLKPNPRAGKQLTGKAFADAVMKCHTKAARRATLAICGLGLPEAEDEEIRHMRQAHVESVVTTETDAEALAALNAPADSAPPRVNPLTESSPAASGDTPPPQTQTNTGDAAASLPQRTEESQRQPEPQASAVAHAENSPATERPGETAARELLPPPILEKIEKVFMDSGNPMKCHAYVRFKGWCPDGDLRTIPPIHASRIINQAKQFHTAVQQFNPEAAKAAA